MLVFIVSLEIEPKIGRNPAIILIKQQCRPINFPKIIAKSKKNKDIDIIIMDNNNINDSDMPDIIEFG